MRILQIAPLWFPVARDAPGGIESFLAQLIPALQRRGCDVTLLASEDSVTSAALVPAADVHLVRAMKTGPAAEYAYYEQHLLQLAVQYSAAADIIHSHVGPAGYVLSVLPDVGDRVLHTVHTPVTPDMVWFVARHAESWLSTVSAYQARKLIDAGARRCSAIPNGIAVHEFTFRDRGEGLAFMGRIESVKGPDLAIRVARELGAPLTLAGPVVDAEFFRRAIEPHLDDRIRYIGIADHRQKVELLGGAACAILPFRREEPFGLVALEAMACGTPVVALARGALPEIVDDDITGCLADSEEGLAAAARQAMRLNRHRVRSQAVARFAIDAVADQYVRIYQQMASAAHRDARAGALTSPAREERLR
jgi:glycosyltransferase involved in cell wall biosynthesis